MKYIVLYLVSLIGLIQAQSLQYCNASAISCHWTEPADACCSPKYGLVVLSLQWTPHVGPTDEFTVHGLWPDTCSGGLAPANGCDNSRRSNQIANVVRSMNQTLYNRMNTYWPSNRGDNNWFWSHEWTKHGTCVSTLRPSCYGASYQKYQDVVEYFEKVLDLRDEFDLYGALNLNGIIPGAYYNVETIRNAIQKTYGANVKLDCNRGTLSEVSLFFNVKGRDTYVITDSLRRGSCQNAVYYPKK